MKKTFVTTMPDHMGAFLKASRVFAALGVNISRVSYNKAVDLHTLFIEAEGTEAQLEAAGQQLSDIGYLQTARADSRVLLLELLLKDQPGGVTRVLEIIQNYTFNISYMSSQGDGSGYQAFKMGLLVEDESRIAAFLNEVGAVCTVRVLDYDRGEKNYDNSIFYNSFADTLAELCGLGAEQRSQLVIQANLAMQMLDERDLSPTRTFECIRKFAELLAKYRGQAFCPRISLHLLSEKTELILIEPPCGSNTMILRCGCEYLFIDTGYAIYREEMLALFRRLLPDYDTAKKSALLTHADVDHCGLMNEFDTVYVSQGSADSLRDEAEADGGLREQNPIHAPYVRITKLLSRYRTLAAGKAQVICPAPQEGGVLTPVGEFAFGDLVFELYAGAGGHLKGEIVLIERTRRLAFTGDVWINVEGLTPQQAEYNRYAPILMTSVDSDAALAAAQRKALYGVLGKGSWRLFGSHGAPKDWMGR
ncbi:MAG: Zn-dependent hydrolase [Christensenellaceae bacterium]|nr:Zn-dependent hydrolase [Christensenellaceae bacterium]